MNEFLVIAISALLGGIIVAAGVYVYPILRNKVQGYPYEQEIEGALLPMIYQAICAAYKLSEESAKAGNELLVGCPRRLSPTVSTTFYPLRSVESRWGSSRRWSAGRSLPNSWRASTRTLTPTTTSGWKTWTGFSKPGRKPTSQQPDLSRARTKAQIISGPFPFMVTSLSTGLCRAIVTY